MDDFYSSLASFESEAMRRARIINENEQKTLRNINDSLNIEHAPPQAEMIKEKPTKKSLFDFSSDSTIIIALLLIMNSEQSDPLLLLALIYILM